MVENICGEGVGRNFDDEACGTDPHFPSDDECSDNERAEEVEFSNDDEPLSTEPTVLRTPTAAAQTKVCSHDDPVCAAGDRCGMKGTKLTNKEHHCQNCSTPIHGALCGTLWAERGPECKVTEESLTEKGKKKVKSQGALICSTCMEG